VSEDEILFARKRIDDTISRLDELLSKKQSVIDQQQAEKEELLKEQWAVKRTATVSKRQISEYEALEQVKNGLQNRDKMVVERLKSLRGKLKSLETVLTK